VEYAFRGVTVDGFGKTLQGDALGHECKKPLIGMAFLAGARVVFQEDGDFELTFPPRSQSGTETASVERAHSLPRQ